MKQTLKNAAFALALCGLASCANEAPWGNGSRGKGGIDLKLTADAEVKDALPSVRAGAPELVAPDVADFSISMFNLDTEQEQTWPNLEEFNAFSQEQGFDVGTYTLTAFYGNINDCGFYKPYFMGKADINVLEGRESSVDVTAQLANVMLSVDYTDAFRGYFQDFSVTAHTDGHANVVFGRNETRAGFIAPGDVTLQLTMTNPSGKSVTITPAQFPAVARHHYHVTFDVNADPIGGATLEIVFDDSLTSQNVTFNLSDELYNAEAPIVHAEGFTSGQVFEALSGNSAPSQIKFESICKAGIQSAVLKIAQVGGSQPYTPPFDTELDLVQADESTQYQLGENGIKVAGIFKNPEQMAIVDLTDLPRYLPEGTFEITLTVTDALGRNNENPVTLNLSTLPIHLEVTGGSALYEYPGTAVTTTPTVDATVMVTYNGLNPKECISFKNKCRTGIFKDCDIVDVKESTATRSFDDKTYIFNIKVCDVETSPLPMELWFNGVKRAEFTLDIIEPEYKLIADPFATYSRFKVETNNSEDIPTIVNGLTLYKGGKAVDKSLVSTDPEKGLLTIYDLDTDTDYTIGYSLTTRPEGIPESHTLNIHTEKNTPLENGNFSNTRRTIDQNMQVGGVYRCGAIDYTNWSQVRVDEPSGWGSINDKTFYKGAKTVNSWFTVVSTYMDNGKVVLRSVGYDHSGTLPNRTGAFGSTTHYNTNTPSISSKAAGELFLGTYSYNGTEENRKEGVTFESRPSSLSFDYSYIPYNNDMGFAKVDVLDASGKVIASGSRNITASTEMRNESISLEGYPFGTKASSIRILFKSSRGDFSVNIPNPNVDSWGGTLPVTPYHHNLGENNYHSFASGSVLTIDNVKLNY
ncbi:MAG: DUF4493 domain-containing protein [Muribaculaceae bacterium]|nr:DUF4493 domain-containing protein [Muribaculaceae bacterium]